MDIISFLLGYTSGKNGSNGNVSGVEEIDLALDEINGEIVGETTKKLAYLAETKSLIKAALIEKGQAVSDTDTFRSYADKVLAIETGGGSVEGVHYVTFMSQDGTTELYKRPVADGDDCADPVTRGYISTPTKESTAQYSYTHNGWATAPNGSANSNALKAVTEDKTVYAAFKATVRSYTVTYYDSDGATVLKTESLAYGTTPSYAPTKTGYQFDGWTPAVAAVTGNASYTAQWTEVSETITGTFTSGATWELVVTGQTAKMTLGGNGKMDDYASAAKQPWANYRTQINSISIGSGITSIGNYSFTDCIGLTEVTIPSGVTTIGGNAFRGCTGITQINLNEGLTTINTRAFCLSTWEVQKYPIASIVIPASVTRIYTEAFRGWKITSATFVDPAGWEVSEISMTSSSWTTLTQTALANTATAATYLDKTYYGHFWKKS
jgi:hypothetical protein